MDKKNKKSSSVVDVNAAKASRIDGFLKAKDEMNSIRLMLSLPNGCNYLVDGKTPIFYYALENDMLTLCSAILNDSDFSPNALIDDGCTPISQALFIDTFDDAYPIWKRKLYFGLLDKMLRHKNTDFTLLSKGKDEVHASLLMLMAETKGMSIITGSDDYFPYILEIAVRKALDTGNYNKLFYVDEDGYSFVSHALQEGNFKFIKKISEILPDYKLSERDYNMVENKLNILRRLKVNYNNKEK